MKKIIISCLIYFTYNQILLAQNNILTYKVLDYSIELNLGNEIIKVDSFNSFEGYIYYIKFLSDSSYFRVNFTTLYATFECCEDESKFKELKNCKALNIKDRRGSVNSKKIFWREIKNKDVEIIYNNCREERLHIYDKIMDSIYLQLNAVSAKP